MWNELAQEKTYHLENMGERGSLLAGKPQLGVSFDGKEGNWNYYYDPATLAPEESALIAGLSQIQGGRGLKTKKMRHISVKEIENYLRVENHLQAFPLKESYSDLLKMVIPRWTQASIELDFAGKIDFTPLEWPNSLVGQTQSMMDFFVDYLSPVLALWEHRCLFVAIEGDRIVVSLDSEEDFYLLRPIESALRKKFSHDVFNIVAEEQSPS